MVLTCCAHTHTHSLLWICLGECCIPHKLRHNECSEKSTEIRALAVCERTNHIVWIIHYTRAWRERWANDVEHEHGMMRRNIKARVAHLMGVYQTKTHGLSIHTQPHKSIYIIALIYFYCAHGRLMFDSLCSPQCLRPPRSAYNKTRTHTQTRR